MSLLLNVCYLQYTRILIMVRRLLIGIRFWHCSARRHIQFQIKIESNKLTY